MQSIGTWMLGAKVSGELNIGRQGENLVSFLTLDAKQYIASYGEGTIQVRHLRSGDASPYPVAELERIGDQYIWTITSGDTAMTGDGLLEVRWYVGDALKISQTRKTRVEPTMQEDSTIPPDVWDGYLDRIHRSGAAVEAAAQKAIQRFDETVEQTTKDTVALVEKTGSNQVSNVKAQEKRSLLAVKDLIAESKQTLETLRSDGVSAIQTQEQSSLDAMHQQQEKDLSELRELSEAGVKAVSDTTDSGLKALQATTASGLQSLVDTKTAGVKEITETSETGLKQTAEKIESGLHSISEAQISGTKAVEEKAAFGLQEMESLRSQGVKELTDTATTGVDLEATEGNVIHYGFIEKFIEELGKQYHILEIAFDRWGATQMVQNLEGMGFTVVPFGQGFKDLSPPTKEFYKLLMEGRIQHGGHPVMAWMAGNVVVDRDPAENIKPTKAKSPEKIDGIVAAIMALDRCVRNANQPQGSVYNAEDRGLLVF